MTTRRFTIASIFGVALGWFFIGSTVIAGPTGLLDDFSGDLSMYTDTLILDNNGGATNTAAWEISGGALQLNTTVYDGIEQYAFIKSGVTLATGEEIQVDITHTGDSQDIGLYVGGTTPATLVRQDYISVYARNDGNVYSRGFDGMTEYGLVGAGTPAYESLFIARTAANTYEAGYYEGGIRNVFVTRTPATQNEGDVVGFYADVRGVGMVGSADNLRIPPPPPVTLTIDRDSGTMSLENTNPVAFNLLGYTVTSAAGGLDPANWQSVTGNFDAAANGGDESFDVEVWDNPTATNSQWTEGTTEEVFGGDGGTLTQGSPLAIGLADAWTKSIYEDVAATMNVFGGGAMEPVFVTYTGNGGVPFQRSDLSFNGSVGAEDWPIFIGNHLVNLSGMTQAEAYQHGDLNNTLTNDYADYQLFRADFIAANGAAAWAALTGATVPEPHTALLTVLGLAGLACVRRRKSSVARASGNGTSSPGYAPRRLGTQRVAAVLQ